MSAAVKHFFLHLLQDLRLRGEEKRHFHGQYMSPVCRARPRAASERHRQLRLQGDDRLAEEQVGSETITWTDSD